jgi:ribonuclease HII
MDIPTLDLELALRKQGYRFVAGLDEAGRGAWAGPVVAAAVILPIELPDLCHVLCGVRDSKQMTPAARAAQVEIIRRTALAVGVGICAPLVIDREGILPATRQAMMKALAHLSAAPDYLVLDHVRLSLVPLPQCAAPKADAHHLSVAAASIIAKVTRDRLMVLLDQCYPGYGFAAHKGYGTAMHRTTLERLGPTRIHRRSFAPLRELSHRPIEDSTA